MADGSYISGNSPGDGDRTAVLVEQAQLGDADALGKLIEAHVEDVRAFVRLKMDPRMRALESCSDVVQSACREVLEGLAGFEYRGAGTFRAWFFTAALNKARKRIRYHQALRRDIARDAPLAGEGPGTALYASLCTLEPSPSDRAIAHEEAERIERAMDRLPEPEREALLLARVVGLPHDEIASRMGRTPSAVRSLLHRASVRLLALLEGRL